MREYKKGDKVKIVHHDALLPRHYRELFPINTVVVLSREERYGWVGTTKGTRTFQFKLSEIRLVPNKNVIGGVLL